MKKNGILLAVIMLTCLFHPATELIAHAEETLQIDGETYVIMPAENYNTDDSEPSGDKAKVDLIVSLHDTLLEYWPAIAEQKQPLDFHIVFDMPEKINAGECEYIRVRLEEGDIMNVLVCEVPISSNHDLWLQTLGDIVKICPTDEFSHLDTLFARTETNIIYYTTGCRTLLKAEWPSEAIIGEDMQYYVAVGLQFLTENPSANVVVAQSEEEFNQYIYDDYSAQAEQIELPAYEVPDTEDIEANQHDDDKIIIKVAIILAIIVVVATVCIIIYCRRIVRKIDF